MNQPPQAFVFDAYGTLFDVRAVLTRCEELFPGYGEQITGLWRTKQLEYSWLRTIMNRYEDFWQLTEDGLRYSLQALNLSFGAEQIEQLMAVYLTLSAFPDSRTALETLQGRPLAILSNGTPKMLQAAVENAGLSHLLNYVISVDEIKTYKPNPAVYALATERLGLPAGQIGFVSSNGWDAAGAKAFGFRVFWLNRTGLLPAEELALPPDAIIRSPLELAELI